MLFTICSLPGHALTVLCGAGREGFVEAVDKVDAIDNRLEKKHKIVPKKNLSEELSDER